jgi:hypothetical protein
MEAEGDGPEEEPPAPAPAKHVEDARHGLQRRSTAILQKRPWNFTSVRRKDDELFFAI